MTAPVSSASPARTPTAHAGVTALTHHHLSNVSCVSSGSLGKRQHRVNSTFGDGNAACLL
ncbi:hypothetical protein ONJ95_25295, partial [Salmonella enterica subsp. enterica serovar Virginia]|nr:hypothetical protein [Salmonella enterica subsp. enterica serovar Virginia]